MVKRYMKICSTSLAIREVQFKITKRYHITPVRMDILNKTINNKCWRGCGKKEPSFTTGGNVNWYSQYGKQYEVSSKNSE